MLWLVIKKGGSILAIIFYCHRSIHGTKSFDMTPVDHFSGTNEHSLHKSLSIKADIKQNIVRYEKLKISRMVIQRQIRNSQPCDGDRM